MQFQNKNFKTKWHLKVARLIRRNRRKHQKGRTVILDQTKEVIFEKNIININNLKNETPIRKFRIQPDCPLPVFCIISNWLYSSYQKPEMPEIFKYLKTFNFTCQALRPYLICQIYDFKTLNSTETKIN